MTYRLHLNENNLIKYNQLTNDLMAEVASTYQYSSKKCCKSTELIARYYSIPKNNVVIYNGLEEAIFYTVLFASTTREGAIVTTEKTYKTVNLSAAFLDMPLIELPLLGDRIDINSLCINIEKCIKSKGKISLCYICNPHNPTGTLFNGNLTQLLILAKKYNFLVFMDQAYIELVEQKTDKLHEYLLHEQLILGRTFSKTYGLAGLRCGYVLTTNSDFLYWMSRLNEVLLFKENKISVAAIKSVLFKENPIVATRQIVNVTRERIENIFANYGIRYIKSYTNFILFQPPCSVERFIEYAERKFGVLLFNAKDLNWNNYIRITISSSDIISIVEKILFQMKNDGLFGKNE